MKFIDIVGIPTYISTEETNLVEKIIERDLFPVDEFNEREYELARKLYARRIILKFTDQDGNVCFKYNEPQDFWRM